MRLMRVTGSAEGPKLVEASAPRPEPGPGELLIRVYAAGVTPTELLWYPMSHEKNGDKRSNAVPGHEFSGTVAGVGKDVAEFSVGDDVYGMNDWFSNGAIAEYCTALSSSVAAKPARLTYVEAATVPIGALTAWQGLFDRARLHPRERVLVHGGAGSVGVFVVQLARERGARVTATASARKSHLAQAIGQAAILQGYKVLYREVHILLDELSDTIADGTRKEYMASVATVPLLILDDFGMRKLPHTAAEDLLEIVMRRYERFSTLLTSNRPVEDSGKLLSDVAAVSAMLDRLLHHGHVLKCGPRSWRTKTASAES